MKKILFILLLLPFIGEGLLLPFIGEGQSSINDSLIFSPAEYINPMVDATTHKMWNIVGDTQAVANTPSCVIGCGGGAHHEIIIDCTGSMWAAGDDNTSGALGVGDTNPHTGFVHITTDNLGNPIDSVVQVYCAGTPFTNPWSSACITYTGKFYVWGNTQGGNLGNNTAGSAATTRPTLVSFPGGAFIVKAQIGIAMQALDSTGTEWRWGSNFGFFAQYLMAQGTTTPITNVPTKMIYSPTSRVIDIAQGDSWLWSLQANGHLWCSPFYGFYSMVGFGPLSNGPAGQNTPFRVDTAISLSAPILHVYSNNMGTYFLCTDGTVWFGGDNSCGDAGDGTELDYLNYTTNPAPYGGTNPFPYNWNQDASTAQYPYRKPVNIAPGKTDFIRGYVTNSLAFHAMFKDAKGKYWGVGRDKGGILGFQSNQIGTNINSTYPNAYDRPLVTQSNPFNSTLIPVYPYYCVLNPSGSPCNSAANPNTTHPTAVATASVSGSTVTIDATGSHDAHFINYYILTQKTGTHLNMGITSGSKTVIQNVPVGTFSLQQKVVNNGQLADSTTVTFSVVPSNLIGPLTPGVIIKVH